MTVARREVDWLNITEGSDDIKRDLSERISKFEPTWLESHFCKRFPDAPARIFVNSMSDIAYWKEEWIHRVLFRIQTHPEHTFLFLTKRPEVYMKYKAYIPANCWLGATATTESELIKRQDALLQLGSSKVFLSLEPLQERIHVWMIKRRINWIIIGMETGSRKEKIIPKPEWIQELVYFVECPVFIKDNLKSVYDGVREYPVERTVKENKLLSPQILSVNTCRERSM